MSSPWLNPNVAKSQREMNDIQLQRQPWATVLQIFKQAIAMTQCPGSILEYGCGVGLGREVLDRAGVPYRSYAGLDISAPALAIARERYPESLWLSETVQTRRSHDIVIDGSSLLHRVDTWRQALTAQAEASRRWLILSRLPLGEPGKFTTQGHGQTFDAIRISDADLDAHLAPLGFGPVFKVADDADAEQTRVYARARHFATYFDARYLPRARAMWTSLQRHCPHVVLHALCWDDAAYDAAGALGMQVQRAETFLSTRRDLARESLPGPARTAAEHMWTAGPSWLASLMETVAEPVTYVDADVFFHSSPEPIFAELGDALAAVIPHGFAEAAQGLPGPARESHEVFGKFNVGIIPFADVGVAHGWAEECKTWCYDHVEPGRYGDQKYLDAWPSRYGARVVQHPGAALGPWAIHTRALDVRNGVLHFGNRPLIAYHYSACDPPRQLTRPEYELTRRQAELLYNPYVEALSAP